MLDVDYIKENKNKVVKAIEDKGLQDTVNLDDFLEVDKKYDSLLQDVEKMRALRNKLSKSVSRAKNEQEREKLIEKASSVKKDLGNLEDEYSKIILKKENLLKRIPNVICENVPVGVDKSDNTVLKTWGKLPKFDFEPKDHLELGTNLDIIDTKKSAEVSGSRFNYLFGDAALLQFALVQFVLEFLTDKKVLKKIAKGLKGIEVEEFIPVVPPVMVRQDVMGKMDRLDPKDDRYLLDEDNLALIGSAEHTLGPIHMGEILVDELLPRRYIGYSTSFRREAGTYGKDTQGIFRVHQFDKLEIESFTKSEDGLIEQDFLIAIQEYILQKLEIPYQVVAVCTGEMGKPDYRQIDIECWIPSQNKYRETHTADYMTDYQSRRLNIKTEDGEFVHMNDATAVAIGRTLIAIMENNQKEDGSIEIPKVLQKYLGKKVIG